MTEQIHSATQSGKNEDKKNKNEDEEFVFPLKTDDIERYINERWYGQVDYFNKKAKKSQKKYYIFQTLMIICGALSSLAIALNVDEWFEPHSVSIEKSICAICSFCVVLCSSFERLKKHLEEWMRNRKNCEKLKRELYSYNYNASAYSSFKPTEQATVENDSELPKNNEKNYEKDSLFVERVETIINDYVDDLLSEHKNISDQEIKEIFKKFGQDKNSTGNGGSQKTNS